MRRFLTSATRCTLVALILSLLSVSGAVPAHAATVGCIVGSSQSCPGDSAWQIKKATGTNVNGIYWVNVNGTATQVYALMDSNLDGGGWMLAMKGTSGGNDFVYSANYWTTSNTLIPSGDATNGPGPLVSNTGTPAFVSNGIATQATANNADAKYSVFNYAASNQFLAIFPDVSPATYAGGKFASANNKYGFAWEDYDTGTIPFGASTAPSSYTQPWTGGATVNLRSYTGPGSGSGCVSSPSTLVNIFSNESRCLIRQVQQVYSASEPNYSVIGNGVFSSQTYINFYGFNYYSNSGTGGSKSVRIGLGWNENGTYDETSNDVGGGIGVAYNAAIQAGDYNGCCTSGAQSGLNRAMGYELYVRDTSASLTSASASMTAGSPAPTGGTVNVSTTGSSWTATAVDNTNGSNILTTTGTGPVTVAGASPNDSITVTLSYTANSGYSGYGTLTYSFYASNGATTASAVLNSGLLSSTYRAGSPITATFTGAPGKATFYFSTISGIKKPIPGCRNVVTTGSGPYTANCAWKPALHGQVLITVVYAPTGIGYLSSTSSFILTIAARSGNR